MFEGVIRSRYTVTGFALLIDRRSDAFFEF
jgi:hypothetical protein